MKIIYFFTLFLFLSFCSLNREAQLKKDTNYLHSSEEVQNSEEAFPEESLPKTYIQQERNQEINDNVNAKEQRNFQTKRQIIYDSSISLNTKNIEQAFLVIKDKIMRYKGFIESLEENKEKEMIIIKVRIPVDNFFKIMDEILKSGEVISYSISAEDVTKIIQDLESRLKLLKSLRERLHNLFKRTKDVKEKSAILKQINRLTNEIEMLETREKFYKNKAAFSTITIYLYSRKKVDSNSLLFSSPFEWVRKLNPLKRTIFANKKTFFQRLFFLEDDFEKFVELLQVPEGFFNNKKEFLKNSKDDLFFSPEGLRIRIGFVNNDPIGNVDFWKKALEKEFLRRNYEVIKIENLNLIYYQLKITEGLNEYYYTFGFKIKKESNEILILEAFYPKKEIYDKFYEKIKNIIKN